MECKPTAAGQGNEPQPRRFQFSVLTILISTAFAAVIFSIYFSLSPWLAVTLLASLTLLSFPALLSAAIYGRGAVRAFTIGTSPTLLLVFAWLFFQGDRLWFRSPYGGNAAEEMKIACAILAALVLASGFISCFVRWACMRFYRER